MHRLRTRTIGTPNTVYFAVLTRDFRNTGSAKIVL